MPDEGSTLYGFWEINPQYWLRCRAIIEKQLLAAGWRRHTKKFQTTVNKRAKRLWDARQH